jgi:acyl-CoA synthetase (AMP-forming)/AMP-acid ligase II
LADNKIVYMNIQNLLKINAQKYPDKTAIIFQERPISFLEVKDKASGVGNYLQAKGVAKGDKVALFLPNTADTIYSILGVLCLGACIVPLDYMLTEEEVINFINHSQAKLLITQPKKGIDFNRVKDSCPSLKEVITELKYEEGGETSTEISESDLAAIFYTSGSTGHPKGVMLSYGHFDNPPETINHFLGVSDKDIFLCGGVPFSHVGGLVYILLMLKFASGLVLMERFHPLEFLKNIQKHKATIFCIVPAMYVAILSLKEYDKFDLASLRFAVVFGAPSSPVLLKRFHKACPKAELSNGWGLTETAAPNCMLPPGVDKIQSIGKFAPGMSAKIVDENEKPVTVGQRGELLVKGKAVMLGYYKESQLTKEVMTADGWFKTGDVAILDEEGLYYIVGRKKEMIKVAGEIVFSPEVEAVIQRHPKVTEAAVIGVSDRLRGEVPKAFIVVKESQVIDEQELKEFLKEHLAHFKIPHYFEFIKELPRNRTGKVDKQTLKRSASALRHQHTKEE